MRQLQLALDDAPSLAREVARYVDIYYPAYRDRHLLVEGGISDQPARYLELIGVIRDMDARTQQRLIEITKDAGAP